LKFLRRLWHARVRNFKSTGGTGQFDFSGAPSVPKFA
jgi:hypothetical protein